jgi:hypothetical protein
MISFMAFLLLDRLEREAAFPEGRRPFERDEVTIFGRRLEGSVAAAAVGFARAAAGGRDEHLLAAKRTVDGR